MYNDDYKYFIKTAKIIGIILPIVFVAITSWYVVEPNEMAGVRRLGNVVSSLPVEPGFYWKIPAVDKIDKISVSQEQYKLDDLTVNSIDNQPIRLDIGVTYRIPPGAVLRLLYKTGESGSQNISGLFGRIISDRCAKIFAQENTVTISQDRSKLHDSLRVLLVSDMKLLFGIDILDVQIADIRYSESFVASVNAAVQAKNAAVAAENNVSRVKYEADQARAEAAGHADASVRLAQGNRDAAILAAEGESQAIRLKGDANAAAIKAQAAVLQGSPEYIKFLIAQTWDGKLPVQMIPGSSVPFISLDK